jgi:hypothetical protein
MPSTQPVLLTQLAILHDGPLSIQLLLSGSDPRRLLARRPPYSISRTGLPKCHQVVPELVLQRPCLPSMQALLGMALFARDNVNIPASTMLASNASRHLELLSLSWSSTGRAIDTGETEQYEQVYRTAGISEKTIREFLRTKAALCEAQAQLVDRRANLRTVRTRLVSYLI